MFRAGEAALPLLLAQWFGSTAATDVYYFAWSVFALAGTLIFSAYQDSAVIPILAEVRASDPDSLPTVRGSLLTYTLAIGGGLAALIGVVSSIWFWFSYPPEQFSVAIRMVVPFCLYLVARSVKTFFAALLNADHRYFSSPVASSLGITVTIGAIALLKGRLSVDSIPMALLLGELVAVGALGFIAMRLAGMAILPTFKRPKPVVQFARLVFSEVGGSAVTQINPMIDQLMAGWVGVVGGGTVLKYAGDVSSVPTSLLQAGFLSVLLSHLADAYRTRNASLVRRTIYKSLLWSCAMLAAASIILFFVRDPLLRLIYQHGEMDAAGVDRMIRIFPYQLLGIPAFGALLVLSRAHVAVKNSGIMVSMGVLNAVANVVFNWIFLQWMGLEGIALATSCVQIAVAVVFWMRLKPRLAELTA